MKTLDRKTLQRFLKLAGDKLSGRWLILGGTLLPLLGIEHRTTTDIDVAGLGEAERAQTFKLMEIAEELGLPVETINQAAAYFVAKIRPKDEDLVVLHQGKSATVYRPNVTLYLQLKSGRLNESDLLDCLEFLKLAKRTGEAVERRKLERFLSAEITRSENEERSRRLKQLHAQILTF